jgi:hypothetical protein
MKTKDKENKQRAEDEDAELTRADLDALGSASGDLNMDGGDDDQLKKRKTPAHFSGDGLDVPGSDDNKDMENIGEEDEENNFYSLGGDNHNDLDED